jgi:LMBR1 domain-containing protein 1
MKQGIIDRESPLQKMKNMIMAGLALFVIVFVLALYFGAGVDWFLATVMAVCLILLFAVNTYIVITWADPRDQSSSIWQILLIIAALSLAEAAILCLPLDVANNGGALACKTGSSTDCGNLNMNLLWEVVIFLIFIFVVILLPMAIFHYEAYDEVEIRNKKKTSNSGACCSAIKMEILVLIVAGLTLGLLYGFIGVAKIPVMEYQLDVSANAEVWNKIDVSYADISTVAGYASFTSADTSSMDAPKTLYTKNSDAILAIRTSFFVYVAALTGWIGWFIFVIFGGIGMASLPNDLVRKYLNRPIVKSPKEIEAKKAELQVKTKELIKIGVDLKNAREAAAKDKKLDWRARNKRKAEDRVNVNQFKQMVFILEDEMESWDASRGQNTDYNPLWPYISLLLGVICGLLTFLWFLHMVLYMLVDPPVSLFLNAYFIQFESWFPLFGTLSVALFSFYLIACVISGLFKVGLRCFCITLHPMRYGKTLMNAFMFNSMWVLFCSIPVVMFSTEAFDSYARYTTISNILGVQVKYLKFFRYFFIDNVFIYCLLVIFGLSAIYLLLKPNDQAMNSKDLKKAIRNKR